MAEEIIKKMQDNYLKKIDYPKLNEFDLEYNSKITLDNY